MNDLGGRDLDSKFIHMQNSSANSGYRERAPYACSATTSRGRFHEEEVCPTRSVYQRDRDRIIHSTAFRRLTYKTQVFIYHEGDHYRTRLTHSLEVAQIARSIARILKLDEDLAEALALAHDLGHTPFGHAGEAALDEAMRDYGGFDHNAQSLRIITELERKYAKFDGLNLTWEMLEGIVKHNGPLLDKAGQPVGRYKDAGIPEAIKIYAQKHDLALSSYASAEAQVAALSDDIAYNNHDIDDGLRAGLITLKQISEVPLIGRILMEIEGAYGELHASRLIYELNRRLITHMVNDVVIEARKSLQTLQPSSPDEIRHAQEPVISFSRHMSEALDELRFLLQSSVYGHHRVRNVMEGAEVIVKDLFGHYMGHPENLPKEWSGIACDVETKLQARHVCDFVAGMTDRFALRAHYHLFDQTPELR